MQPPLIQFRQVYKQFGNNQVLNGVDLDIFGGEITTVIGKSGGGKSVLLKHIIGFIERDRVLSCSRARQLRKYGQSRTPGP